MPYLSHHVESFINAPVYNLQFSPCGDILAAQCANHTTMLVSAQNPQEKIATLVGHQAEVNISCFTSDHHLLTGSDDMSVKGWDLRRPDRPVHTYVGAQGWVKNIELCPGGFLASSFDGTVRWFNINDPTDSHVVVQSRSLVRMKYDMAHRRMFLSYRNLCCFLVHDVDLSSVVDLDVHQFSMFVSDYTRAASLSEEEQQAQVRRRPLYPPPEALRRENRVELLFETERFCSTSLQLQGGNLLTRGSRPNDDELCSIFDLEQEDENWLQIQDHCSPADGESKQQEQAMIDPAAFLSGDLPSKPWQDRCWAKFQDPESKEPIIREPCFTSCGEYIASPYDKGVRIFQLPPNDPTSASHQRAMKGGFLTQFPLENGPLLNTHEANVLTTKSHPHLPVLASGADDGSVNIYQCKF